MSLDREHQDRLVQWLSAPAGQMQEGAQAFLYAMQLLDSPHVRMRPAVYRDGDQWCALYGDDLQHGVAGFGETPEAACRDFDSMWATGRAFAAKA